MKYELVVYEDYWKRYREIEHQIYGVYYFQIHIDRISNAFKNIIITITPAFNNLVKMIQQSMDIVVEQARPTITEMFEMLKDNCDDIYSLLNDKGLYKDIKPKEKFNFPKIKSLGEELYFKHSFPIIPNMELKRINIPRRLI